MPKKKELKINSGSGSGSGSGLSSVSGKKFIISFDPAEMDFSVCALDIASEKIQKWEKFSIAPSSTSSHEVVCQGLISELVRLDITKNVWTSTGDSVIIIIERQPKTNLKTLTITGQIFMFFSLEKMGLLPFCVDKNRCHIEKIVTYQATNKLKFYTEIEGDEPLKVDHLKDKYYKRKQTAVQHTRNILKRDDPEYCVFFNEQKKKDDYADAYLQARAYICFEIKGNSKQKIKKNPDIELIENAIKKKAATKPKKTKKKVLETVSEPVL